MISAFIRYEDGRVTIHDSATKEVGKVFSKGFYRAITKDGNLLINEESLAEIHAPYSSEENILILRTVEAFFRPDNQNKQARIYT